MTNPTNPTNAYTVPSVSITTARTGASSKANALGMRAMQELALCQARRAVPADQIATGLGQIPSAHVHRAGQAQQPGLAAGHHRGAERSIGGSFADEPLSQFGFYWDWQVAPQWNLCNAPGVDELRVAKSKVDAVRKFLESTDKALVCTHATFRFAVEELGVQAFDNRLIAVDEFHHVSSNPDNVLGNQLGAFIARDKVHLVAMTGSYFRGDSKNQNEGREGFVARTKSSWKRRRAGRRGLGNLRAI